MQAYKERQTEDDLMIIHRYFWPQNYPYAQMLKSIAEVMVAAGLSVAVCSSYEPNTSQREERIAWARQFGINTSFVALSQERKYSILQKFASAVYFACWVLFSVLKGRSKVVWVASTPPLIMPIMLRVARLFRRFKVVYHCQDIHPEALLINENIRKGLLYKVLRSLDRKSVDWADQVIVLSSDMKQTLVARGCRGDNICVINNFVFAQQADDGAVTEVGQCKGKAVFLFAGSLGRFQNLEFVLDVFAELAKFRDFSLIFLGDGPIKRALQLRAEQVGLDNVIFIDHQPVGKTLSIMDASSYGIVSLAPGVDRVAYPSKSLMYLSRGLPLVAFVAQESELGKLIGTECLGVVLGQEKGESPAMVAERLHAMLDAYEDSPLIRDEIRECCHRRFSQDVITSKLVKCVEKVLNE